MNKIENKFIGLCLAKNNYFAATICRLEEVEGYANVYVMVNRKDTWESYKSFSIQSMFSDLERKQWYEAAEKFIAQLEKPEDWKKPHRFCLARYARQMIVDNIFHKNLAYFREVDNITRYIWHYNMDSRSQEVILIRNLNLLSAEETKQLFILKEWEKQASSYQDINNALYGRRYLYKRIYNRNKFKDYYEKYNNELKNFIAENKDNIIGKS
ncbi:hypothetical protein [Snodgrassella alvi]|uniref:hypothetical protein n=1 Tax=Snodgrassella alvi TaxID=1196083 RepID=UPI000998920E|nr:hypothetical protein [Snodgrassella alvi]OOX81888.1 hypothetical protein BGH94_00205 [Snodgrassella alvi]ORF02099.1 hypothetical protein BGH95_05430 [Snodgrassella alvi]